MTHADDERRRALEAAYELHRRRDAASFPAALLDALARLVPCESAVLVTFEPRSADARLDAWPAGHFGHLDLAEATRLHASEHPFVSLCRRSRSIRALRLADLQPREAFQRTALYTRLYRFLGIEHQLLMLLASPGERWRAVALNRKSLEFTEEECRALESLWPHITLAQRQLRRDTRDHGPALDDPAHAGAGVVVIRGTGEVTLCTERARRWLTTYYGGAFVGRRIELPEAMSAWALAQLGAEARGRSLRAVRRDPLHTLLGSQCLVAELIVDHGRDQHLIRLEEIGMNAPADNLETLGLTPREAEVLCWVAQGKTNREVGMILGSSARTVQKHLEHVFQKIGVESRTAAILKAWTTRPSSRR